MNVKFFIWFKLFVTFSWQLPDGSYGKEFAWNVGDPGSVPGLGRSPGEGNDNPLQYSCLKNPWTEEFGGLQSMGSQRVRHNWVTNTLIKITHNTNFSKHWVELYWKHIFWWNNWGQVSFLLISCVKDKNYLLLGWDIYNINCLISVFMCLNKCVAQCYEYF